MATEIAKNIRWFRKKSGLTQEQLAQQLFVTRQTVSLWELGKIRPDVETLQKIADCFHVDLMQILYGPEYRPSQQYIRAILIWALFSSVVLLLTWGTLTVIEVLLSAPRFVGNSAFSLIGNFYLWMSLYGCPFLALFSGGVLGNIVHPIIPSFLKSYRVFMWILFVLLISMILFYLVGIIHGNLPVVTFMAWKIQDMPWVFLLIGGGLCYCGRIILNK